MTRHKKPKTIVPQASDSPTVRRMKQVELKRRFIDESGDYPIAVWSHRWSRYVMDDRPGLYTKFYGKADAIDGERIVAAWSTFDKAWAVFMRLSDDEAADLIEQKIEYENLPF